MKTNQTNCWSKLLFFVIMFLLFSDVVIAQTDTLKVAQPDTTVSEKNKDEGKSEKKKRKDEFIFYAGASFNQLFVSSDMYESTTQAGYLLGFDYKRGKFFYWQVGVRYNNAVYKLKNSMIPADSAEVKDNFYVRDIDIPLTGGINFLSALNRIVALRIFISAIPAFTFGVEDNDLEITKDKINTFNIYGQAGVGFNVAFLVIEAGYNYGFIDLIQDDVKSKPGQVFVNLGFRF